MPRANQISTKTICTNCFKTLGVEAKYVIYKHLKKVKSATVGEIVDVVELTQPTVSYHLKHMQEDGLLHSKRMGKEVHYSINENCPFDANRCTISYLNFEK